MLSSLHMVSKRALPLFAAALITPLSGASASAVAVTVKSSAHYQAALTLTCSAQTCRGEFSAVGNRRRLNLTRVTCHMHSAQYAAYASGKIDLRDAGNISSVAQFLPAAYSTDWGFHVINSTVDLEVTTGRQFVVTLFLAPGGGNALDGACTAHGTLDILQ